MEIETRNEISVKDIERFQIGLMRYRRTLLLFAVLPVLGAVLVLTKAHSGMDWMLCLGIFFIVFPISLLYMVKRYAKKMKRENAGFRNPVTYRFMDEKFQAESQIGSTDMHWPDVFDRIEGRYAFYIFISSAQAFIVPKSWFTTEQVARIRGLLEDKVAQKKNSSAVRNMLISIAMLVVSILTLIGILVK